MNRGTRRYQCPKCGNIFTAPDIELNATAFSAPQPCPKCGHLCTGGSVGSLIGGIAKTVINLITSKRCWRKA